MRTPPDRPRGRTVRRLQDRVAIVTGGARGLGEAITRRLVDEGARVVVGDVLVDEGAALAKELGDSARFEPLDVRRAAQWDEVVAATEAAFGPVTTLVNNAGIVHFQTLLDTGEEDFRRVLDINE